jgi:CubicO group peptidase (beta-lactamase class C family)
MRYTLSAFFVALLNSTILFPLQAQVKRETHHVYMEKRIDSLLKVYQVSGCPGASVLVYEKGRTLFAKGYGIKNITTGKKVNVTSCFRLASLTKQFTAMSVLQLYQAGKLSLDSPAHRYLDSMPVYSHGITLRHLLTHTSGLVDYEDLVPTTQTRQVVDIDCLRLMNATDHLYFQPGSEYRYSNTGYAILALIVQNVSGQDFAGYLRRHIFQPLGMSSTVALEEGKSKVSDRAMGHSRKGDGWKLTDQSVTSAVLGDGGVYTNLIDYSRWITALFAHQLIPDSLQQIAWCRARLNNGLPVNYGFGWHIDEIRNGPQPHHSGSSIGFRNHVLLFPKEQRAVLLLTNRDEGNPFILAQQIADKVWPESN